MTKGKSLRMIGGGLIGYGIGVACLTANGDIKQSMFCMAVGCALAIFGMEQK